MRLTVVGCAGSFPSASSPASCYLIEHEGFRIVLDLGNGSLGALQEYVDLEDPDGLHGVVLSHCHIDHCADLASLYVVRTHHPRRTFGPLPLLGPAETLDRVAGIHGAAGTTAFERAFEHRPLTEPVQHLGPLTIEAVRAAHPVEAYCVRVTSADGSSVTYSGDTGPHPGLDALARGTDIALFEASYATDDRPPDLHLSGADAGRAAMAAGAGLLVLTHLVAWNDQAQVRAGAAVHFDGPIELARPGLQVTIGETIAETIAETDGGS